MSQIVFTQHALDRFMERARVRNPQTAMEMIEMIAQRVRPLRKDLFAFEDHAFKVDSKGVIQTYYRVHALNAPGTQPF